MMAAASIRKRTLALVILLVTSISCIISILGFINADYEVEELFDARLAQQARSLYTIASTLEQMQVKPEQKYILADAIQQQVEQELIIGHRYESKVQFQIWLQDKLWLATSAETMPTTRPNHYGFATRNLGQYQWRTFTLIDEKAAHDILIWVAEREDVRGEMVEKIVWQTIIPELIGLPLLTLCVWFAIGWGLSPLQKLTRQIRNRDVNRLEPIHLDPLPTELVAIQGAINDLMQQIQLMLLREQRFIADAAHELRTPLTVLKLHAENALSSETLADREQSLQQLIVGVDRSTRIVAQLLTLARLEHQEGQQLYKPIDVLKESRHLLAEIMPLAWRKQIDIVLQHPPAEDSWLCPLIPGTLDILLQNLITNSIKASSHHCEIEVWWIPSPTSIQLTVIDHGSGVDAQHKQRLVERFYREGDAAGAGLGLAIVQKIVLQHQAKLYFSDTQGGGLTVSISFPRI